MKKVFFMTLGCLLLLSSCVRRELTYGYDPTVKIVLNVDWSDMETVPTGMSVYCYPDDGGSPTVIQTNNVSSAELNLGVGNYNLLIFNQIPSDFGTINFSGLDNYYTAQVAATTTTSKWYASKADEELVRDPEDLAAATYHGLEVTQEAVDAKLDQFFTEDEASQTTIYMTINVDPKVVVKTTRVSIALDAIYNHSSTRASLYGMAQGYTFSTQKSHTTEVTHLLESWSKTLYDDPNNGEIIAYFSCFGIPGQTTETRTVDNWDGTLSLEILLVDNATIESYDFDISDKTTLTEDSGSKGDEDTDINAPADIYVHIDEGITLPDVEPVAGSDSSFGAEVDDWGDEVRVEL